MLSESARDSVCLTRSASPESTLGSGRCSLADLSVILNVAIAGEIDIETHLRRGVMNVESDVEHWYHDSNKNVGGRTNVSFIDRTFGVLY